MFKLIKNNIVLMIFAVISSILPASISFAIQPNDVQKHTVNIANFTNNDYRLGSVQLSNVRLITNPPATLKGVSGNSFTFITDLSLDTSKQLIQVVLNYLSTSGNSNCTFTITSSNYAGEAIDNVEISASNGADCSSPLSPSPGGLGQPINISLFIKPPVKS